MKIFFYIIFTIQLFYINLYAYKLNYILDKYVNDSIVNNTHNDSNFLEFNEKNQLYYLKEKLIQTDLNLLHQKNNLYIETKDNFNNTNYLAIGISYYLLNNGKKNTDLQIKIKKNQLLLNKLLKQEYIKNKFHSKTINKIIKYYNYKKYKMTSTILDYLGYMLKFYKHEFLIHKIAYVEIIKIKSLIKQLRLMNNEYKYFSHNYHIKDLPVFDFYMKKIIKDITKQYKYNKILYLKKKNLEYQNLLNEKKEFKLYSNMEYKHNKAGWNIGFNFKYPLYKNKNKNEVYKYKILQYKFDDQTYMKKKLLKRLYYEYKFVLKQYIQYLYKFERYRFVLNRYRLLLEYDTNVNTNAILETIKNYLLTQKEIFDIKQKLYIKAVEIINTGDIINQNKYIRVLHLKINMNDIFINKSIYVWENGFKKFNNKLLVNLLKINNLNNVLLSVSKHQDFKKFNNFINLALRNNINIELLLSNNNWVEKVNTLSIKRKIKKLYKYPFDFNLDIEMNTLKKWKNNKKYLYHNYEKMLYYIDKYKNPDSKINMSIPLSYSISFLKGINNYINKYYIMAYNIKHIKTVIKNIKKYKKLNKPIVIVLNAKEYSSVLELNGTIDKLKQVYPRYKFAIHNLKTLIKIGL